MDRVDGMIPPESFAALSFSPTDEWASELGVFLEGLGGGTGVFEWIHAKWGVQLDSPESIATSGLDGALPFQCFSDGERWTCLIPLRDAAKGRATLKRIATLGGGGEVLAKGTLDSAFSWKMTSFIEILCGQEGLFVACIEKSGTEGNREHLESVLARSPSNASFWSSPEVVKARGERGKTSGGYLYVKGGDSGTYRVAVDGVLSTIFSQLGPGAMLLGGLKEFVKSMEYTDVTTQLKGGVWSLSARQKCSDEGTRALESLFGFDSVPPRYGELLPRDAAITLATRLNLPEVRKSMGMALKWIPKDFLGKSDPLLRKVELDAHLLRFLEGDIAVSVLGIEDSVGPLELVQGKSLSTILKKLNVVVVLSLVDPEEFRSVWRALAPLHVGYEVLDIPPVGDHAPGFRLRRKAGKGWVVAGIPMGDALILTFGNEAYPAVRDVLEGRATPLHRRVESKAAKASLMGAKTIGSVYATFGRISREWAERGGPVFFLRMIGSIYELSGRMAWDKEHWAFEMEIRQ